MSELLLPLPFVPFRPSMEWMMPTHIGEDNLLSDSTNQMLIPVANALTDTLRNMLYQSTLWPVLLTHIINYHTSYVINEEAEPK